MTIYTLGYSTKTDTATYNNTSLQLNLRRQRKVPQGTGMRIIGQVAGHEIDLEIEDVLDKKNEVMQVEGEG